MAPFELLELLFPNCFYSVPQKNPGVSFKKNFSLAAMAYATLLESFLFFDPLAWAMDFSCQLFLRDFVGFVLPKPSCKKFEVCVLSQGNPLATMSLVPRPSFYS